MQEIEGRPRLESKSGRHTIFRCIIKVVRSTPPAPCRVIQALILLEKSRTGELTSSAAYVTSLRRSTSKGERPHTPPSSHFSFSLHPCLHLGTSQPDFKISQLLTMTTVHIAKKPTVEEVAAASQEPPATGNGGTDRINSLSDTILSSIISLLPTEDGTNHHVTPTQRRKAYHQKGYQSSHLNPIKSNPN
jgi:hypothetical protein